MNTYKEGSVVILTKKSTMIAGTVIQLHANTALVLDKSGYIHSIEISRLCPYQDLNIDTGETTLSG